MNTPTRNTKPRRPAATMEEEQARYEPQAHAIQEFYGGAILAACMAKTFGTRVDSAAFKVHLDNILAAAGAPTDPIEVMMVQQLAWAHARLGDLHARAAHAESLDAAEIYNAAAVRLMAEFRKGTLALREYRTPVAPRNVTLVSQQNVAAGDQQVAFIEGGTAAEPSQKKCRDNELAGKGQEAITYEPQIDFLTQSKTSGGRAAERVEARPLDAGGAGAASTSGHRQTPMGEVDWPKDGAGQAAFGGERQMAAGRAGFRAGASVSAGRSSRPDRSASGRPQARSRNKRRADHGIDRLG